MEDKEILETEYTPVLIVGGSIVGMTLSALLAQQGLEGAITIEKHKSTAIHPRAALLHPRTMQIYRELGLYDQMRDEAAIHYDENAGIIDVESLAGKFRQSFMKNMNEGIESISPTVRIFLTQRMFEPMLLSSAEKHGAKIRFSTELLDFEQSPQGVTAVVRNNESGQLRRTKARYMVACDGNRSSVREKLKIGKYGYGLLSRSLTIYFKMDVQNLANAKNTGVIYVTNEKVRGFFRLDKTGHDGFFVVFTAGQRGTEESRFPADEITDEKAADILRSAIGADIPFEITLVAKWEAVCDMAHRMTHGSVLLAGDAAHTVTPQGGYGGNTGVQDAHNLAWKMVLVLKGTADPALVNDTYHAERYPVGRKTVDHVYNSYLIRTAPELRKSSELISQTPDPHLELGYRYHSAALDTAELGSLTEDPATAIAKPGSMAHHVVIDTTGDQKIPVSDLLGKIFVLLMGKDSSGWEQAMEAVSHKFGLGNIGIYRITSGEENQFYQRYGISTSGAVLIRPDGFVAWFNVDSNFQDKTGMLSNTMSRILCLGATKKTTASL